MTNSRWDSMNSRHSRLSSNTGRKIEPRKKTSASALWDVDAFEGGFWDYSGAAAGWQVTTLDLGDPALSMGMVDEDGRFAWMVKDYTGKEIASGASRDLNDALDDAEMAYRIASDEDMDFMSKRTALLQIRSLDEDLVGDVSIAPDSQMPIDTGDGNIGTVQVEDASESNDPDFERNEVSATRTAGDINVKDVEKLDEGWFQYETPDGAQLSVIEDIDNPGSWTIEVVHPDGTYEEKKMDSENIMDPIEMGVSFYNEVAPSGGGGSNQPVGIPSDDKDSDSYGKGGTTRNPDNIKRDENGKFAGRKTSSMWDTMEDTRHKVAGWDYDNLLEGYVTEGASAHFACVCGSNVEAPGYTKCVCGKIWNSYPITSEGSTRVMCREIPDRGAEVLLANRSTPRL